MKMKTATTTIIKCGLKYFAMSKGKTFRFNHHDQETKHASSQCQNQLFSKISPEIDHSLSLSILQDSLSVPRMKSSFWANDPTECASHDQRSLIVLEERRHQSVTESFSEKVLR